MRHLALHPKSSKKNRSLRAVSCLGLLFVFSSSAYSQTYQSWQGNATSGSWQGATNWWDGSAEGAIASGQQEWNNNHYTTQTNDNGGSTLNTWRFLFQSGASSAHTFSGDAIRFLDSGGLDPSITNQSAATHIIVNNIQGDGDSADPLVISIDNNSGGGLTFNGTINNQGGNLTLNGTANSSAMVQFNGVVSGAGGLTKGNSNILLQLNAANTYTGATTISVGTLEIGAAGGLGGGNYSAPITNNGTFLYSSANNQTLSGIMSGTGSLTKNGSSTLTLTRNNTFTGGTIVNSGTLVVAGGGSQGTIRGNLTVNADGWVNATSVDAFGYTSGTSVSLLTINGGTVNIGVAGNLGYVTNVTLNGGNITSTAGGSFNFNTSYGITSNANAESSTISSNVKIRSGSNMAVAVADGAALYDLVFSGAVIQEGGTGSLTKNGFGTLLLSGNNTYTGTTTINAGTFEIGASGRLGGGAYAAAITNNSSFILGGTNSQTLSGILSGTGSLTQNGTGTLTINNASNSYSGGTQINAGTIVIGHANALGTGGNLSFGGGGLQYGTGITTDLSARIKNSSSAILIDTNAQNVTFASAVDSSNTGGLTKNGTGNLTLSGANSYTGTTTINTGSLILGADQVIGSIAGAGSLNISSYSLTAAAESDTTFSGVISGAGSFTKNGSGNQTLAGENTYTGGTTINAGTLTLMDPDGGTDGIAVIRGTVTVNSGAMLAATNNNAFGYTSGSKVNRLVINGGTVTSSAASDQGWGLDIEMIGGTLAATEGGNYTLGGGSTVETFASADTATISGGIRLREGNTGNVLLFTVADGTAATDLEVSGAVSQSSSYGITKNGTGTMVLSGANTYTGTTTINAGTLEIGASGRLNAGSYAGAIANSGTFIFSGTNNQTLSGTLSGTGSLTQNGSGTLTLNNASNGYSGGTQINAGTIVIGHANGLGTSGNLSFGGGALQYGSGITADLSARIKNSTSAILVDTNGQNVIFASAIDTSNIGGLTKNGSGNLTLSGANFYTGTSTINAGSLVLGANQSLGSIAGAGNINLSSYTLTTNTPGDTAFSGVMSGTGSFSKVGAGVLNLSTNNTYSGTTTISSGTLSIGTGGSSGSIGSGNVTLTGPGVLDFNRSNTMAVANNISGNGTVRQSGSGTLQLSGSNTNDGAVAATAGTILFSGANALSGSAAELSATNATLSLADGNARTTTLGNANLALDTGAFVFDIGASSDRLTLSSGAATMVGTNTVNLNFLSLINTPGSWTLVSATSGLDGTWSLNESFTGVAQTGYIFSLSSTATDLTLTAALSANNAYWKGNLSGNWSETSGGVSNWTSDAAGTSARSTAPGDATDVIFSASGASNLTTSLGGDLTVKTLTISDSNGVTIQAGNTLSANSTNFAAFNISATSGTTTINASLAGAGAGLSKSGDGTLVLGGTNTYGGGTTLSGGTLTIHSDAALGATSGGITINPGAGNSSTLMAGTNAISLDANRTVTLSSGTLAVNSGVHTLTISGEISGAGALTKAGSGIAILSANNTYTGQTSISAGTLQLGNGGAAGSLSPSSALSNNGVLIFNRSNSILQGTAFAGTISGTGSVVLNGTGSVTLNGTNTYSGGTTVNSGTLVLAKGGGAGTVRGVLTVNSGGLVNTMAGDALGYTVGTSVSQLTINGGTVNIGTSGNIGFATNVTLTGGNITSTGGGSFNFTTGYGIASNSSATSSDISSNITIRSGSNLAINVADGAAADDLIISGAINNIVEGNGSLTKNGAGTLLLSGSNTFTGNTTVNAGTLVLAGQGALGSSPNVVVNNGGSLLVTTNATLNPSANLTLGTGTSAAGLAFSGNYNSSVGALTLSADSIIDLGTNNSVFLEIVTLNLAGYNLRFYNWDGNSVWSGNPGAGNDRIYVNGAINGGTLANISFYSSFGSGFLSTAYQIDGGLYANQIIAVPEPEVWLTGLLLLAGAFFWKIRQVKKSVFSVYRKRLLTARSHQA